MAPRLLPFLLVKRINPRVRHTYGHWWIEIDGAESYGWWPSRCPVGFRGLFLGLQGVLNGRGAVEGGGETLDPYHAEAADHAFHPTLMVAKNDETVRREIREFAKSYADVWRWQWWWSARPTRNCRSFQDDLFAHVGLVEGEDNLYTRGPGCPFMFPLRRAAWMLDDRREAWADRLKRPSGTKSDPLLTRPPSGGGRLPDPRDIGTAGCDPAPAR